MQIHAVSSQLLSPQFPHYSCLRPCCPLHLSWGQLGVGHWVVVAQCLGRDRRLGRDPSCFLSSEVALNLFWTQPSGNLMRTMGPAFQRNSCTHIFRALKLKTCAVKEGYYNVRASYMNY